MFKKLLIFIGILFILQVQAQEKSYNCYFELNSAEYSSDSLVKFQEWLHLNMNSDTVTLDLIAYTDTIGSLEYNDKLAIRRLGNIATILKSEGYTITDSRTIGKRYTTNNYSSDADFRKVEITFTSTLESTDRVLDLVNFEEPVYIHAESVYVPKKTLLEEFEELGDNKIINLNIEFKVSSNIYKNKESEKNVAYLAQYLLNNPQKKLIILGHVCCSNNQAVSISRAKRVYDDLKKMKINKKRMKYKGMSNSKPLVEEIDAKTEQQNRRVEVLFYE